MKHWILICFLSFLGFGQNESILLKNELIDYKTDHLGNKYFIYPEHIEKQSTTDFYHYSNPFLGKINTFDVKNPMEIGLFYRDFSTFVVLDNKLSEKYTVDFSRIFPEIKPLYISITHRKDFWIVDEISGQLFLYESEKNYLKNITNIPSLSKALFFSDSYFFYIHTGDFFIKYDQYGRKTKISQPFLFDKVFAINNQWIVGIKDEFIYAQDHNSNTVKRILKTNETVFKINISNQKVIVFTEKEILIFDLNLF